MSARGLAAIAALLFALCAGAAALLADRLGWLGRIEPAAWAFENPTLGVPRGQRVVLRPIVEGVPSLRYTFLVAVAEPDLDDPVAPLPHLRAGVEEQDGDSWYYRLGRKAEALLLCQMGALTDQEWLEEIRPVREVALGGGSRDLLLASFGHRNGSRIHYLHDAARPVPAVGWTRSEMLAEGRPPEVHFALDGGRADLPER